MITTATVNREHIKSFLRLLLSGADRFHCEIRTVPASRPAHFFCESPMLGWDDTEISAIADHCINKNVDGAEVYVTLNNSLHKEYGRNEGVRDSHVKYRDWILIDCDPDRTENLATEVEKERARELASLVKQYLCESIRSTSIIEVDSGNGYHLLVRCSVPAHCATAEKFLGSLDRKFKDFEGAKIDTCVHNPSRITKVAGTVVRKGATPTDDRPFRASRLLSSVKASDLTIEPHEFIKSFIEEDEPDPFLGSGLLDLSSSGFDANVKELLEAAGYEFKGGKESGGCTFFQANRCPSGHDSHANAFFVGKGSDGKWFCGCRGERCQGLKTPDFLQMAGIDVEQSAEARAVSVFHKIESEEKSPDDFVSFPVSLLPEEAQGIVNAGADSFDCDASLFALPAMISMASAVGASCKLRVKDGHYCFPMLWGVAVGAPGTGKSPAVDLVTEPIKAKDKKSMAKFEEEMNSYQSMMEIYKEEKRCNDRERREAARNNEELPDRPVSPVEPICSHFITTDTTVEALTLALKENPRGILVSTDEMKKFFGSMDRYVNSGGGDQSAWLSMHSGGSFKVIRKSADQRVLAADSAVVSLMCTVQPGVLRGLFDRDTHDSGMAARFLMAMPPSDATPYSEKGVSDSVKEAWAGLLDGLYGLEMEFDKDRGCNAPQVVNLSADGFRRYAEWTRGVSSEQNSASEEMQNVLAKLRDVPLRYSLIDHLSRWGASDVSGESMDRAIQITEWFKKEAIRIYGFLRTPGKVSEDNRLVKIVRENGGKITTRELTRKYSGYQPTAVAKKALDDLVSSGLGRWEEGKSGKRGPSSTKFILKTP